MVTGKIETERKYEARAPVALLPSLADLPQVTAESADDAQQLDADYFDTADLRLIRAGVTLRRRHGGSDAGWHLKLPAGPDSRRELHQPFGEPGEGVPDELARLVRAFSRGAGLAPVAHIRTARSRRLLRDGSGSTLAEVVLDDVSAESFGRTTTVSRWQEAEIELADGDRRLLDDADKRLRGAGFRPASHGAKLQRALAGQLTARDAGPVTPETVPLTRRSAAADVVLSYLREQAKVLQATDPLVRLDEPGSVHKLRVTCRRIRAALQSFGSVLPAAATRELRGELRWLGQVAAAARDGEVQSARLQHELRQLPAELVLGPVQARVQGHFAPLEAGARQELLDALDSDRYLALLGGIDGLLADPPRTEAASRRGTALLAGDVAHAYRRVRKRIRRARRAPAGPGRDAALHEARKAAKRARYAADVLRPVSGKNAVRFGRQLKKLQSVLGDHQDAVTARGSLRGFGVQAFLAGENGFTFGLLYGLEHAAACQLRRKALRTWKKAARPKYRRWLH